MLDNTGANVDPVIAPVGWILCGCDASGLELRGLGAMLAHFDDGEYARLVSTDG